MIFELSLLSLKRIKNFTVGNLKINQCPYYQKPFDSNNV